MNGSDASVKRLSAKPSVSPAIVAATRRTAFVLADASDTLSAPWPSPPRSQAHQPYTARAK